MADTPPTLSPRARNAGLAAAVIAACTAFTPVFEGTVLHTYRDPAPRAIVTSCTGHTGPELKMGMTFTPEECKEVLAADLQKHWDGMQACVKVPLTQGQAVAFLDLTFNVGVAAFCNSSLLRKLNAGDALGACQGLLAWVYAGGKQLPGLVRRRREELRVCLS